MKLTLFFSTLLSSTLALAFNLSDLKGTYKVTHPQLPIDNIVTISASGKIQLQEISANGKLKCSGKVELKQSRISSEMVCSNKVKFTQKINLTEVRDLKKFQAPVFSSLYGQEVVMDFVKIK